MGVTRRTLFKLTGAAEAWRRLRARRAGPIEGSSDPSAGGTQEHGWRCLPSQWRFLRDPARFSGFSGPVGSGKSAALVTKALHLAKVNAGRVGVIGAPTYPMLRDVTQRAFFDFCDEHEIEYEFHKAEKRVVLENGSEIWFRSLEKFERLRGTNLAWFGIDELTYCQESAWMRLLARLRDPQARHLCGFGVWTPKGFDWVYRRFIDPSRDPVTAAQYSATLASPRENIHLPADFYSSLERSYDERFAAQEVGGKYLNIASGQVYHAFSRSLSVRPYKLRSDRPVIWSLDFNVSPMCSVIAQIENAGDAVYGTQGRILHVADEIALMNSHTLAACEQFEKRMEAMLPGGFGTRDNIILRIYGDPAGEARSSAGKSDYQIIREFFRTRPHFQVSYHVRSSAPKIRDRVNAVNAMLRNSLAAQSCFVDPKCKGLIGDFEQVIWAVDANGNPTGEIDKRDKMRTHLSDALGYLIESEFGFRQHGGPRGPGRVN